MKKKLIYIFIAFLAFFALSLIPVKQTFANSCGGVETSIIECGDDDGQGSGIKHVLELVVDIMSIGIGILGVVGISIVGTQYLTAGGSEEKTRKAKRRMFEIILGLAAYALIYALLKFLLPGFGS